MNFIKVTKKNIVSKVSKPYKNWLDRKVENYLNLIGYTSTKNTSENDIWIVGYPKSGNTWMQSIIAGLVYGIEPSRAPDSLVQELVPDIHYKSSYKRFKSPMFFKSHHLPQMKYKKVIYIIRDGRDVMVSLYHFLQGIKEYNIEFKKVINGEYLPKFGKWDEHISAWISNPYDAEMMFVKYEDLLNRPEKEIEKICEFIQLHPNDQEIERVIRGTSFEKMKSKETQWGLDNEKQWKTNQHFFRRGKVASYKDEMPEEIQKLFVSNSYDILEKLNYL